jgi:hypothetical protein
MELPLSQLIYAKFQELPNPRRVITLHRYNNFLDGMREIGLAVNPDGVVLGLQSSKGVYIARSIVGYTWFVGPLEQPSPVHFGDSMQEIERFLWDEVDRQSTGEAVLPFLVGDEQGAIMALAMAGAVPDLLSGVVAINATFPAVPGWEPPLAPLNGLPILIVNSAAGDELTQTLERWGAAVKSISGSDGQIPLDEIRDWIGAQRIKSIPKER